MRLGGGFFALGGEVWGERGVEVGVGESDLSEMVTFMKMVITRVENGSPDMIPVAFERKFNEKFDEIPPGIYRRHIVDFFQYWGVDG